MELQEGPWERATVPVEGHRGLAITVGVVGLVTPETGRDAEAVFWRAGSLLISQRAQESLNMEHPYPAEPMSTEI